MASKHILVPIGFSDQSLIALEQAVQVAKVLKAKVTLISVIEESNTFFGLMDDKEKVETMKKQVDIKLKELTDQYKGSGLSFATAVRSGSVYHDVVDFAEKNDVNLIVMGTDGKPSSIAGRFIGSNAYRIVTSSPCPVITIKGKDHRKGLKKIILPLDLEKETKQKVAHGIQFAKLFGAEIHVISVVMSSDEFIQNTLKRNLKSVSSFIQGKGITCVSKLLKPKKGESLSDAVRSYATEENADLIIIMTQQEGNITEFFLGSAAQSLIYPSNIPVKSIRPKLSNSLVYDLP